MQNSLIEITEALKKEYNEKLSKVVGFDSIISELQCSFCGKQVSEVEKLVAGNRVYICNECITISNEIIQIGKELA